MTNKEKYIDIMSKCSSAIETIRYSERVILHESNPDIRENMYMLSINTLRLLLDNCFEDGIPEKALWEILEMDEYFEEID